MVILAFDAALKYLWPILFVRECGFVGTIFESSKYILDITIFNIALDIFNSKTKPIPFSGTFTF